MDVGGIAGQEHRALLIGLHLAVADAEGRLPNDLFDLCANRQPIEDIGVVGGEGEGIFAVTYNVKGSMEEPEISVNPLSVLAPGFLRGLFTGRRDDDEEPRAFPQQLEKRNKLQ